MATIPARTHPVQPEAQSQREVPPLIEAVWKQDRARVEELLAQGADPDALDAQERPPWMWAVVARDTGAVHQMLSKVRALPFEGDRKYALPFAASRNDIPLARALLVRGLPVNGSALDGATALLLAAANGHEAMIGFLLSAGADVNAQDDHGDTALMAAVRVGSLASVKRLLAAGAEVDRKDDAGRTARMWAVRSGNREILDTLVDGGTDAVVQGSKPLISTTAAVERSLKLIQEGTETWIERTSCTACHHQPLMLRAVAVAQRNGYSPDVSLLERQVKRLMADDVKFQELDEEAVKTEDGILRSSLENGGDFAFAFALLRASYVDSSNVIAAPKVGASTLLLARMQLADGSWRFGPPRVPIESSDIATTAMAVRAMTALAPDEAAKEVRERVDRASAWLRGATPILPTTRHSICLACDGRTPIPLSSLRQPRSYEPRRIGMAGGPRSAAKIATPTRRGWFWLRFTRRPASRSRIRLTSGALST